MNLYLNISLVEVCLILIYSDYDNDNDLCQLNSNVRSLFEQVDSVHSISTYGN